MNGRMPVHFFSSFRIVLLALFSFVIISFFAANAPLALADPHAVFYTDRAQEQLFYNVLAALNQADYVEPSFGQFPYTRQNLVAQRAAAPVPSQLAGQQTQLPFTQETNPTINATHTDLPSVVTRNITLEGNDVWTAYLVQNFALETSTRKSENELARVYCERGFGIVGCNTNNPLASQEQGSAFVTNTGNLDNAITVGQDAILRSGSEYEQGIRNYIATQDESTAHKPGDPAYLPRPDNAEVSALNKNIEKNNQTLGATVLNTISKNIINPTYGINPDTFNDVTAENGNVKLASTIDTADKYLDKLQQIANLPAQLLSVAQDGANQQREFVNNLTNTPSLADFRLSQNKNSGGLDATFTTPSSARLSAQQALANAEANAGINQHYASPNQINDPRGDALVTSTIGQSTTSGAIDTTGGILNSANIALNPTPTPGPNQGQVAGTSTSQQIYNAYTSTFDTPPQKALSPSVNAVNPDYESGLYDGLVALTNNTFHKNGIGSNDPKCAFCIKIDQILNNQQNTIGDLYCALFPSTASCFIRNPLETIPPTL